MILLDSTRKSLLSRIRFLCTELGFTIQAGLLEFEPARISLAEQLATGKLTPEQKIMICYLAILARYPYENEIETAIRRTDAIGLRQVMDGLLNSLEFSCLNSRSKDYFFTKVKREYLHIDITHTSTYNRNTGVQRVVRNLVADFKSNFTNVSFVLFEENIRPRLLSESEFLKVEHYRSLRRPLIDTRFGRHLTGVIIIWNYFLRVKKTFAETSKVLRLRNSIFNFFLWCAESVFGYSRNLQPILFLWQGTQLLLPEVTLAHDRLRTYLSLAKFGRINLDVIVYDLIPLTHPNLCADTAAFVHYARLLQYAHKISCISKSVAIDLKRHLKITAESSRRSPTIQTHYLGFGMSNTSVSPTGGSQDTRTIDPRQLPNQPLVICLGTIEERKNQLRILRAAMRLYKAGRNFSLLFAGNLGWHSEYFLRELEKAQALGYHVWHLHNLSDSELQTQFRAARFSVFCSLAEGFGLPILESVHLGVPCLVSNFGSCHEIASKLGACVEADPESVADIAAKMEKLLSDDIAYGKLKAQTRKSKWVTWDSYARNIYAYLQGKT